MLAPPVAANSSVIAVLGEPMISRESIAKIMQDPATFGTASTHDPRMVPAPVAPSRKLSCACPAVAAVATRLALTDEQTWRLSASGGAGDAGRVALAAVPMAGELVTAQSGR